MTHGGEKLIEKNFLIKFFKITKNSNNPEHISKLWKYEKCFLSLGEYICDIFEWPILFPAIISEHFLRSIVC